MSRELITLVAVNAQCAIQVLTLKKSIARHFCSALTEKQDKTQPHFCATPSPKNSRNVIIQGSIEALQKAVKQLHFTHGAISNEKMALLNAELRGIGKIQQERAFYERAIKQNKHEARYLKLIIERKRELKFGLGLDSNSIFAAPKKCVRKEAEKTIEPTYTSPPIEI
jgi:hypothetical protein